MQESGHSAKAEQDIQTEPILGHAHTNVTAVTTDNIPNASGAETVEFLVLLSSHRQSILKRRGLGTVVFQMNKEHLPLGSYPQADDAPLLCRRDDAFDGVV